MTDTKTEAKAPRAITAADIDAQGNVTIWDHGPIEAEADSKSWHEKNGDGPVPIVMNQADAAHAMQVEPTRYSLDPIHLDDGEVVAEAKKTSDAREAAKKAAEERALAIQRAADLKAAAVTVLAARQAKAAEAKTATPKPPAQPAVVVKPASVI